MKSKGLFSVLYLLMSFGAAFADANCPAAPKEKWLSEVEMKKKIAELGYKADVFKGL